MGQKLLKKLIIKTCLLLLFAVGVNISVGVSQSLAPGDIAFTGFNTDTPGGFAVVLFREVPAGSEIHFSEGPWQGNSFDSNAGGLTWRSPSDGVSVGTVLSFSNVNGTPSVNIGSISDGSTINLSGTSSVIYAYTGADKGTPQPPFLAAAANSVDKYNGTEGTLSGTGLTNGIEAILLSAGIDVCQFIGNRSGNTVNGYQKELNKNENWEQASGTGSQVDQILPFETEPFTIVPAPTMAFSAEQDVANEGDAYSLTVELFDANGTAVNANVEFLGGTSTATAADIGGFSTANVSFGSSDSDGASQTVSFTITDDSEFEGDEKAVFKLRNNSAGTVISPETFILAIGDDDSPNVVINEFLADPPTGNSGDANGDGTRDSGEDEFIEIVNSESEYIDISGWQLSNDGGSNITYTFPAGTVLSPGRAIVVFGGGDPSGQFGSAIVQAASGLNLANSSGHLALLDDNGTVVDDIVYGDEAANEQSVTRDPDQAGFLNSEHSSASGSGGALYSPGTKIDGTSFGVGYAVALRGTEGWRMIASPVQGASFEDLFGDLWVQGIVNSDAPSGPGTIFSWSEPGGGSFVKPQAMTASLVPGKGYIIYVFEDDKLDTPGVQGGFPKVIRSQKNKNGNTISVDVTANDADGQNGIDGMEGWNLLGNPFSTDISVDALFTALETAGPVNTNIYVWDHDKSGGAGYTELTKGNGERLAPYQAFWVKYEQDGINTSITLDKSDLSVRKSTDLFKGKTDKYQFVLELYGGEFSDTYKLEFAENGETGIDQYDGHHLFSLNPDAINIFSYLSNNRLQKNVLPKQLESTIEIPLNIKANGRELLEFRWDRPRQLPNDWKLFLIDTRTNEEIPLQSKDKYSFKNYANEEENNEPLKLRARQKFKSQNDARFILKVQPKAVGDEAAEIPGSAKLNPNYPNPFNPTTTLSYELAKDAEVTLTIWNMIGQKVATLVDGPVEAGKNEVTWNASNMPSGIYIARFEVGGEVFTRKMTLIK